MPLFKKKDSKKDSKQKGGMVSDYPKQMSHPFQQQPEAPPSYPEAIGQIPPQGYPMHPNVPQTIFIQGGFDAGARFDHITPPKIPPPPPGCLAHPAQAAAAMGCSVQMTQRKNDYFEGGSNGGYSLF